MVYTKRTALLIIAIFGAALLIRLYHLTFQSLWLDEIYTMLVADPGHSVRDILSDLKTDFHPPFHYFVAHFFFRIAGYNDFTGRLLSAVIGLLGVVSMYFFGTQIRDRRTGVMMALLTAVNYYHIYHSQEVRMYSLMFLLTALSSGYFLKAIKTGSLVQCALYVFFTMLLLYTHYFGLFVFGGQALFLLHLIIRKKNLFINKKLIGSLIAIVVLYLPWVPYLFISGARTHWMKTPDPWYIFVYLYELTGKEPVGFLLFLTGFFLFFKMFLFRKRKADNPEDPAGMLIIYGLLSLFIITWFVSLVKPVLQLRCAIAALPFILAAVVLGLDALKTRTANILFSVIVISAIINISFVKKYYTTVTKENYRDVAGIVNENHPHDVVISRYSIYYNYYFRQLGSDITAVDPAGMDPGALLDKQPVFVVLNAHDEENIMTSGIYRNLIGYVSGRYSVDTTYRVAGSKRENAVVYILKENSEINHIFDHSP